MNRAALRVSLHFCIVDFRGAYVFSIHILVGAFRAIDLGTALLEEGS